jgi:hypothetical protein
MRGLHYPALGAERIRQNLRSQDQNSPSNQVLQVHRPEIRRPGGLFLIDPSFTVQLHEQLSCFKVASFGGSQELGLD